MKAKLGTLLALAPAAVMALNPLPAQAGTQYFLKVEGAEGESTAKGHEKWIELDSWKWGVTAEASWTKGGGASVGKPQPGEFEINATMSKASPVFYKKIATGESFGKAELHAVTTGGNGGETYSTIVLSGVYLTSIQTAGGSSDTLPHEGIKMVFKEIDWKYKPQDSKTGKLGAEVRFKWNIPTGEASN